MDVIRKASLASHAAASEVGEDIAARSAAHAAGQAVATAHVPTHSLGAAIYALQAIYRASDPSDADAAIAREREWQYRHLLELSLQASQVREFHATKSPLPVRRPRYPMPDFIQKALEEDGLAERYRARPPYQRNDYIGWITRAKTEATRSKRLVQMLDELKQGRECMGMAHRAKNIQRKRSPLCRIKRGGLPWKTRTLPKPMPDTITARSRSISQPSSPMP